MIKYRRIVHAKLNWIYIFQGVRWAGSTIRICFYTVPAGNFFANDHRGTEVFDECFTLFSGMGGRDTRRAKYRLPTSAIFQRERF